MDTTQISPIALISPGEIEFDNKNPRGETPEQIEEDSSFKELRKSVKNLGVLVPMVTRKTRSKKKSYKLVDGERRLRAALSENKELVPIHVIEGKETDGRILAYNIHMLRKQWTKTNELTSIKEIRDELLESNKNMTDDELFVKLKGITNHTVAELRDLLRLLKYDRLAIKKVQDGTLAMSHLIQIDASFLAPLKREFPKLYEQYGDSELRRILVSKAENGKLGNTRYLMDYVLKYFKDSKDGKYVFSENKTRLIRIVKKFLEVPEQNVNIIVDKMEAPCKTTEQKAKTKKKKKKATRKKVSSTADEKFEYASIKITKPQQSKINDLRPKFEEIATGFSGEEVEYAKEAIYCIEKNCFKAAALMIWATGISRILKYIKNHLSDFNKCSREMASKPRSFYKHFAENFQKNVVDISDIRENSNDRQLLCYICHKNFVNVTQFKKLKNNYDTRNDCAHPTSISLSPNEIIVIFENVYDLILNNPKIR